MPNLNKVMLMGNLTRDPEIKYTPKGTAIANFGIAVNRTYTPEGGEKREEVTFIDLEAFGRTAEVIGEYFKKGRPIFIEGRLKLDQWDDKTSGKKMSKLRVVVDSFEFLGSREGGSGGEEGGGSHSAPARSSAPPQRRAPSSPPRPPADPDLDVQADDVPF
ncbi:MAG: single-stranded DNA-binding protein [Chthoniobacteraceae bacterium]